MATSFWTFFLLQFIFSDGLPFLFFILLSFPFAIAFSSSSHRSTGTSLSFRQNFWFLMGLLGVLSSATRTCKKFWAGCLRLHVMRRRRLQILGSGCNVVADVIGIAQYLSLRHEAFVVGGKEMGSKPARHWLQRRLRWHCLPKEWAGASHVLRELKDNEKSVQCVKRASYAKTFEVPLK